MRLFSVQISFRAIVSSIVALGLGGCFPSLPSEEDVTATNDASDIGASDTGPDGEPDSYDPLLNACGGAGPINGPAVDDACGPCGDGRGACDPNDILKNKTICTGARLLNACGGCSDIVGSLGSECGTCGNLACNPLGSGNAVCVEPSGGCETWLVCDDLNCEVSERTCVGAVAADATCGACLEGRTDVAGACLRTTSVPTSVTASTDRDDRVEIHWEPQDFATAYRVYRCGLAICGEADWALVPNGEVAVSRYADLGTEPAPEPPAPIVSVSADSPSVITLRWAAVTAPTARSYRYRVTALAPAGETLPSMDVVGSRAPRAIDGYEVRTGDGAWKPVGDVTEWNDANAPAPTVVAGIATASQATHANFVALAVSGIAADAGQDLTYQVRAVSASGVGAQSGAVVGRRAAPSTWAIAWERSAGASAADFELIPNATGNTWNDTDAPADGAVRYYRARVVATGAPAVWTAPVSGSRLPPPGVPGNVGATTDFEDRVVVSWNSVPEALGYHVYRNGTKLTSGNGISGTSFDDTAAPAPSSQWVAPSGVVATTSDSAAVTVTWTAPIRPVGADATYQVASVNAAGEGAKSASATGRRARPALVSFEVETSFGQATNWVDTFGTNTTWVHGGAPAGILTGVFTATDGDFRAQVKLVEVAAAGVPGVVTYRVRGKLEGGGYTLASGSVTGSRAVGAITRQWQRSATASAVSTYNDIEGATGAQFNDTGAPADGAERYYRLRLSAPGADTVALNPLLGRRLAIVQVSAGGWHTCAVARGGRVWCWGAQGGGRLGNGQSAEQSVLTPTRLGSPQEALTVSSGMFHTCATGPIGEVWCWGENDSGQTAGPTATTIVPTQVANLIGATSTSAGRSWSCASISGGTAWCWGNNSAYQLGNGTTVSSGEPQQLKVNQTTFLTGVVKVYSNSKSFGPHTCATLSTGTARCWGNSLNFPNSQHGYLGIGGATWSGFPTLVNGIVNFTDLAMGALHACGIAADKLYCWGGNELGQLGLGDSTTRFSPVQVALGDFVPVQVSAGPNSTCVKSMAKTVRCWGDGANAPPVNDQAGLIDVESVSVGSGHVCSVGGGGVKCWGNNDSGQLGNGSQIFSQNSVEAAFP